MKPLKTMLMMAAALSSSTAPFEKKPRTVQIDPTWKRKRCKTCQHLGTGKYGLCGQTNRMKSPKNAACDRYSQKIK